MCQYVTKKIVYMEVHATRNGPVSIFLSDALESSEFQMKIEITFATRVLTTLGFQVSAMLYYCLFDNTAIIFIR